MQDFSGSINLHLLLLVALKKLAMQVEAFEVTIKMKKLGLLSTFLSCAGLGFVSISNLVLALPSQDGSTRCWQIENGWQWRCAKSGYPADELLIHNRSNERVLFDIDTWVKSSCSSDGGNKLNSTPLDVNAGDTTYHSFQAAAQGTCVELTFNNCRTESAPGSAIECPRFLDVFPRR